MRRVLETIAAVLVLAMMLGVLGYTGWFWTGGGVDMGMGVLRLNGWLPTPGLLAAAADAR